ncbi:MAG: phosphopentomutase, partial [Candidatus Krumholzibacteria bacterium]|nr:phosphopentomutase [Candidatus Krumholzibacteria bacterium]
WELMGCPLSEPFPVYTDGFPPGIIERFEKKAGRCVLGNRPASGTEIIERLGPEHIRTGKPIVYTSADSVFQIAAHEDVIPAAELYSLCEVAREILVYPHNVARVIARPFTGKPGSFVRTLERRDFSLPPPGRTLLDLLSERGHRVVTVGKIHDLFVRRGIDEVIKARGNEEAMRLAAEVVVRGTMFSFLFINLIDFDMLWGHRRDCRSYARGLERFDTWLGVFLGTLKPGTLVSVTADHGCDPTAHGSDHTREYVPIIAKLAGVDRGISLGTRDTFSDLAATLAGFFGFGLEFGESFLDSIG